MKAPLLTLFFLALLAWIGQVHAQSKVLYEQSRRETLSISSDTNPELRAMAQEMTRGDNRRERLVVPVEYEWKEKITRTADQVNVQISMQNLQTRGRVQFRSFDMMRALQPSVISAKVQLLGQEGKVLQAFDLSNRNLNRDGNIVLVQISLKDTSRFEGYKLRIEEKQLGFSSDSHNAVSQRVALINEYYRAEESLEQLQHELATVNPEDIERLPLHSEKLKRLEQDLRQLQSNRFEQELNLREQDPIQLISRMREVEANIKNRGVALNQMIARLPEIYYNRGVELALNGSVKIAREFFERSLQVNPAFAPSHLQIARLDLKAGYLKDAATRTKEILNRMEVDPETFRFAQQLGLDIQNEYVYSGEDLNDQGKFSQALQQFEEARDFCRSISSLRCRSELWEKGIAQAKSGLYNNLLREGRFALGQGQLKQAEQKANDALAFAKRNQTEITSNSAAQTLMRDVQEEYYQNHLADGRKAMQSKQYSNALTSLEKARVLADEFEIQESAEIISLRKQAAKPVILSLIESGQKQATANQLAQARTAAAQVTALQVKYGLVNDKVLESKFKILSQSIFSQQCANAQAAYDKYYQGALKWSADKQFSQAWEALEKAIAEAKQNAGCSIPTATAEVEMARIEVPARYQQLLEEVSALVNENKMTEAVQTYEQANAFYGAKKVDQFGLSHEPLFTYGIRHTNKSFVAEVTKFAATNGDAQKAIDLLKRLVVLDYSRYNFNQLQELVGEQLATRDAQANPKADYKQLAETYTNGDKDLKKLNKAYQKKFKKLT